MEGEENDFFLYECLEAVGLQQHYARFTAAGVYSAAHLSGLTMEDYPNLGISSMEDRTRLFRLVQTIKSLDVWCDESECNSSDSEENHRVVDDGLSLCSGLGHDGDDSCLSGVGRCLDFSGKALGHNQNLSCYPARLHVSSTHNRSAEAGGAPCVQFVDYHDPRDHDAKTDTHRNPTYGSHRPPHISPQELRSDTVAPMQQSSRRVWHKEREGISKKETHRLKALEQKAVTVPVYESRTAGYNYGLPLSSPPAPNKRPPRQQRISVCVRKRPLTHTECRRGEADVVTTSSEACVTVNERKEAVDLSQYVLQHSFYFDQVFGEESTNEEVYQSTAYPLVQHMLHRGSATCFAYGQTGAGKTHTMLGSSPDRPGLYALAVRDIFAHLLDTQTLSPLLVFVSFFEIYCGQLYDLLDGRKRLFAREDRQKVVHIAGLHEVRVDTVGALLKVVSHGMAERTQGMSGVNAHSSRSHAMLQIQLRGPDQQMAGRMWFVDLAGSERASDTKEPDRQSRLEGAEINQSLLALKECIRSLDQAQSHTPFRQSKLTQVLKDSFLGDSMTCMIANIAPGHSATEHTLNTLRYADRVKELKRREAGRRGKTVSSKHSLTANKSCNKSRVATRGKSPPKRPKLVPYSSALSLTTEDPVFCSTPKKSSCARASVGTRLEELTPIRGFLGISVESGGRKQKHSGEYSYHDQSHGSGPHSGRLHLRDIRKKLTFSDEEQEKGRVISNRPTRWNRDTCPERERERETSSPKAEQKQRESHLKQYHQQLQQLMPSLDSSSEHLSSTSTCFSCSHQVPMFSPSCPRYTSQASFDLDQTCNRGQMSSFSSEGHNKDTCRVVHDPSCDTSKDLRILDTKSKYGKEIVSDEKERTLSPTGQDYRRPVRMESGGKRRRAWGTPAGIPQINTVAGARQDDVGTPMFKALSVDTVLFHAESACHHSPAQHPFSPTHVHTDTLKTLKGQFELAKGRACTSDILPSPSQNTRRVTPTWLVGNDGKTIIHNASNLHNEPLTTSHSMEDPAFKQVGTHPDTDGKMSILAQGKASTGFTTSIMDPLSISLLEVDQQATTASFLQGKQSNLSLFESREGGDKRNGCKSVAFSILQSSSSESVQKTLPKWHHEECSDRPSNISVQMNSLFESHIDKKTCDFHVKPRVHLSTLEDIHHAQCQVVQAHWDQMEEMETLFRKEGTLLYQQPDMEFGEYIHKLGEIMVRKAKCVHSMIAQLQPYLKSVHSNQRHNREDDSKNKI